MLQLELRSEILLWKSQIRMPTGNAASARQWKRIIQWSLLVGFSEALCGYESGEIRARYCFNLEHDNQEARARIHETLSLLQLKVRCFVVCQNVIREVKTSLQPARNISCLYQRVIIQFDIGAVV